MSPRPRSAALVAAGAALPSLYAAIVRAAMQMNLSKLRDGELDPLLRFYAKDVRFRFPGRSSWAVDATSLDELRPWLQRFIDVGMRLYADDIAVSGPPWNTTLVIRLHDHCDAPDGTRVYENRGVIFGRMAWGRLREYEVFEDTEKVVAFDAWLAQNEDSLALGNTASDCRPTRRTG